MEYTEIIKEITDKLTGEKEEDLKYLSDQADKYRDHEYGLEILRAIGRIINTLLPAEEMSKLTNVLKNEALHIDAILNEARKKLEEHNLDEAFHRIRTIIAPNHLRIRAAELGGSKRNTPCLITGECNDCRAIDRLCNVFSIIEGKPMNTEINVIIVGQDLGLGWDPTWPQDRIKQIRENYKKFVWISPPIV